MKTAKAKPAAEQAPPKPLSLSDIAVSYPRWSMEKMGSEPWPLSGQQLALLIAANRCEGNLHDVANVHEIAEEIRGLCGCLKSMSGIRLHGIEPDNEVERQTLDFLERSLRRIADRIEASDPATLAPEKVSVTVAPAAAEGQR
jgi:hypothetical protein